MPEDVRKSLGIRKGNVDQIAVAEKPTRTRPLVMPGSTALDPARLIRVRVRFAPAEVVEIGKIDDPHSSPGNIPPLRRDLQAGDPVKKGDLLAVLFSVDVGNKKNDLFDALAQLRLDEEVLQRAEARTAAVPEVFLLNARRNVEADMNAVNRAENTLKTWAVPEDRHPGRARRGERRFQLSRPARRGKGTAETVGPRGIEGPGRWIHHRAERRPARDRRRQHDQPVPDCQGRSAGCAGGRSRGRPAGPARVEESDEQEFIGWTVRTVGSEPLSGAWSTTSAI